MTRGNLRAQIAFALFGRAHVAEKQRENVGLHFARAHDSYRWDAEAFLVDLAAESHRTWINAANIRVVGARGDIKVGVSSGLALRDVHRCDQCDIWQVCSAAEGIIQNHHVARPEIN